MDFQSCEALGYTPQSLKALRAARTLAIGIDSRFILCQGDTVAHKIEIHRDKTILPHVLRPLTPYYANGEETRQPEVYQSRVIVCARPNGTRRSRLQHGVDR